MEAMRGPESGLAGVAEGGARVQSVSCVDTVVSRSEKRRISSGSYGVYGARQGLLFLSNRLLVIGDGIAVVVIAVGSVVLIL